MGGKSSKGTLEAIDPDVWQKVGQINSANIVKNRITNEQGQQRTFVIDPRHNFSKEKQIYAYRRDYDGPLVRVLAAEKLDGKKTSMCGKQQIVKVITEVIPYRWSQISKVSYQQSIYALEQSLRGYEELYEKVGPFEVTPQMIGINQEGQIKVWLNQNFAQNHPTFQKPVLQTTNISPQMLEANNSSQSNMVRNVIDVIQRKYESGKFPYTVQQSFENNSDSFFNARNSLSNYIKTSNLYLPTCIKAGRGNSSINEQQGINGFNRFSYTGNTLPPLNNTNRYTLQSNTSSIPNRTITPSKVINLSQNVSSPPHIRILSPTARTTYFSPRKSEPYPTRTSVPSFGNSQNPQPIARFTYQSNPIETSQVTQRYY